MKNNLSGHVKMIFQALGIESSFCVYDCMTDSLPNWASQLHHTHQYFVCGQAITQIDKLKTFIGKDIRICNNMMYWYDGNEISMLLDAHKASEPIINQHKQGNIIHLKSNTRLPSWLDDYIFKTLEAQYAPDYERFDLNLRLTKSESLRYLGTYFPRSYSEAFCILDNLFSNKKYLEKFSRSRPINIAVIGCGTGGDLIGLLTVIEKYSGEKRDINIVVVDGNYEAIDILEKILNRYKEVSKAIINLKRVNHIFTDFKSFDLSKIGTYGTFDFVMNSKMICEIISMGNGYNDDSYYEYITRFIPLLNDNGIFYLLDVTTRQKHSTYNPFLLNEQVQKAMKELPAYRVISPLPCSIFNSTCPQNCFYQKIFTIAHSHAKNDRSKVAYKLIASSELALVIGIPQNGVNKYLIHNDKFCPNTELWDGESVDAFYFPKDSRNNRYAALDNIEPNDMVLDQKTVSTDTSTEEDIMYQTTDATTIYETKDALNEEIPTEYYTGCYVIDTNVFLDKPDIIQAINSDYFVVLSAKVLDELDHLKIKKNMSPARKKRVTKALKNICESLSDEDREIVMEDSDIRLLPKDFDSSCPDNKILSVALKFMDENPILLTSDYGLQARAKGLGIKSISLKDFTKTLN